MPRFDALRNVHGHDAARDMRHAAGHDRHQLTARRAREERPDGERGFRLAHEDAGGYVHAFSAGDAHGLEHDPRHGANDDLHEADVIENREEGGDENNGGQHLEGEDGAGGGRDDLTERAGVGKAELAEQDAGARERGREHAG